MIDVSNQNPLIRRAFMDLEDGEWFAANKHCEEALNQEPENAYAYLGKLLAKLYCHNPRELLERETPLSGDPLFEKILYFGTQDLRDKLNWIDQGIAARIEEKRRVQAQEEEEQRIQEEEAAAERKKKVIRWLKRLVPIVAVWIFVVQVLIPFFHYTSIERAKVGDYVKFGRYQGETLTWLVLDVQENKKLLLTEFGIERVSYDGEARSYVTWEHCSLRKWLNDVFYYESFNEEERSRIIGTYLANKDNPERETITYTWDKVFCLNTEEVEKYFKGKDDRCCLPTEYAVKKKYIENRKDIWLKGVDTMESYWKKNNWNWDRDHSDSKYKEYCTWWLRDGGTASNCEWLYYKVVDGYGNIVAHNNIGHKGHIYYKEFCVVADRPALWVEVEQ